MIKTIFLAIAASLPLAAGAMAREQAAIDYLIAQGCDMGNAEACRILAISTNGQCASPGFLGGCHFDSRY